MTALTKPAQASTSVRPVGAGEVARITKMTGAEFEKKMDSMSMADQVKFSARTEPGYKGKDKIELVLE